MKKIPKLRLCLWQEILYTLFTVGAPAVITCIELFQTHSTILKISFSSIGALLISLIVIKKFFISNKIDKVKQKTAMLEHDYSIGVGDADSCKQQWAMYNLFIFIYNAICILTSIVLLILFVNAIANGIMAFKGAALLILLFVFVGIIFKIICYLTFAKSLNKNEEQ